MITTITTVSTMTVFSSYATALGALGTVLLILLLIVKELSDSHNGDGSRRLAKNIMVAVAPLLSVFVLIVMLGVVIVI